MLLSNEYVTEGELINRILTKTIWKKNFDSFIIGSPQKIIKEICGYMDLGVDYFVIYFPDLPNTQSLELFAKYVIEYFRY
jgi:alkanesulfonate monooxygenase SsuD/methylene tetrahydromethanopterin reductase-like flavin-dependent oxidoreductase (luciferase family)